ncbi:Uma2 family endonuclease [Rhodococcus sp. SMB37]|uniref:Uma2 family endonuclease n=1 Tax=Rhodococcus sp. SMB37 TaxID=2512213 RepID=UPI0010431E36|nr:Uma2 family endonuclease [Rhodococcus sp. SMB37]TCN47363.1 Uma2 family endonuclease [Rhodococcus sp. SMB37]
MSVPSFPDHLLSLDEWARLPEYDRFHVELCEGVLVASPRPGSAHNHAALALALQLDDQLPGNLCVLGGVEVLVMPEPLTVRVPDAIVVDRALVDADPDRAPSSEVRLVLEVTVDGTARTDRVTKFSEYAEAGIPQYWIVDLTGPPVIAVFTLDSGWYRYDGEHSGAPTLTAAGNEVTVDLRGLAEQGASAPADQRAAAPAGRSGNGPPDNGRAVAADTATAPEAPEGPTPR